MSDIWNQIVFELCKVEAVCTYGEPNWLGWLALAVGTWLLVVAVVAVLITLFR